MTKTLRSYFSAVIWIVLLLVIFCAKKKNPAKWENPQDNTGANWHPPTVQVMEGGAVPYRDTLYVTAIASDSNGTILDYCWDINGSGYHDTTLTGTLDVYLPDTGWYTVRVKARDNDKLLSQPDSVLLYATFHPPHVVGMPDFTVSIFDTFTLSAAGTDLNGSITKYLWALDGVNYTEETVVGSLQTVFDSEGVKSIKVRAVDDDDLQSLPDEINVTVRLDAPEVTAMGDISVSIYDTISITATSTDPNGSVISYHWAFDGLHFVDSTDTGFVQHVFDSAGVYDVKVKVKDDDGLYSPDHSVRINVKKYAPELVVMEDFTFAIYDTLNLIAAGYDSNGSVIKYVWNLDGSGFTDTTITGTIRTVFMHPGSHAVDVYAIDDHDFASAKKRININVHTYVPHVTSIEDTVFYANSTVRLRATGSDTNGVIVKYYWSYDNSVKIDSTDSGSIDTRIADIGTVAVSVMVRDDDAQLSDPAVIRCIVMDTLPQPLLSSVDEVRPLSTSITLIWRSGLYNRNYMIRFGNDNPPMTVVASGITDTSYTITGVWDFGDRLYWRVSGENASGACAMSTVGSYLVSGSLFMDERDSTIYRSSLFGSKRWMTENIKYGITENDPRFHTDDGVVQRFCYSYAESNCNTSGGLYTFDEATQYNHLQGAQGVCPDDWHVPSDTEWRELELALGMDTVDVFQYGYRRGRNNDIGLNMQQNGTSGFEAVLAGHRSNSGIYSGKTTNIFFWTSSYGVLDPLYRSLDLNETGIDRDVSSAASGYCVRCVRD